MANRFQWAMVLRGKIVSPAVLALIGLALIWGYNWVIVKVSLEHVSPYDFSALRTGLGAVGCFGLMFLKKKDLHPKLIGWTILLGILTTSLPVGLSTWSLVNGGAGKMAILVYTMPFWVLILAWPILNEHIKGLQWLAIVLAFAGLFFILEPWNMNADSVECYVAVAAGLSWAAGSITLKLMHRKTDFDLLSLTTWQLFFGALPLLAASLIIKSPPIQWTPEVISYVAYNIIFTSIVAHLLWFYALSALPAGIASMGVLAVPVIGLLSGIVQLKEIPDSFSAAGIILILAGLAALGFHGIRQREEKPRIEILEAE